MSTRSHAADARALLASYASALGNDDNTSGSLCMSNSAMDWMPSFIPRCSWIIAEFRFPDAVEIARQRAHADLVAHLTHSVAFDWQRTFHSFWKDALVNPLRCSTPNCNAHPSEYDDVAVLAASRAPRFLLNFAEIRGEHDQLAILRAFFFKDTTTVLDAAHNDAVSRLVRAAPRAPGTALPRIEIGIVLSSRHLVTSTHFRAFAQLLADVAEHEQRKSNESNNNNAVQYEITTLWLPIDKVLVPIEIDLLIDMIAAESPTIRHLVLPNANMMLAVPKRFAVFQQLLRTTVCSLAATEPTLETLQLKRFADSTLEPIIALCSALRYPNALKELCILWHQWNVWPISPKDMIVLWAWIAYGMFHPDSACRLDRLNLTMLPLPDGHEIHAFADTISDPHAAKRLYRLQHGSLPQGPAFVDVPLPAAQRVFVRLATKTKVRAKPRSTGPAFDIEAVEDDDLEVAIECAEWLCVIVPGFGFGWTPRAAVTARRTVATKCPALTPNGTFEWRQTNTWPQAGAANVKVFERCVGALVNADRAPDLECLLCMIGRGLEGFAYPAHGIRVNVTHILRTCPNLTHLNVGHNTLDSSGLETLLDQYELGQCRIEHLNVATSKASSSLLLEHIAALVAHPAAAPLQYLAIRSDSDDAAHWQSLERALASNHTLRVLFVNTVHGRDHEALQQLQASFKRSVLTPRMRAAFLSIIQHRNAPASPSLLATVAASATPTNSSIAKLDSSIVAQIFAFSGVRFHRRLLW